MTDYIHDDVIEAAIAKVKKTVVAAKNSNHAGEVAILRAAAAGDLVRALQAIQPYCSEAPDDIKALVVTALAKARGDVVTGVFRKVA